MLWGKAFVVSRLEKEPTNVGLNYIHISEGDFAVRSPLVPVTIASARYDEFTYLPQLQAGYMTMNGGDLATAQRHLLEFTITHPHAIRAAVGYVLYLNTIQETIILP